MTSDPQAFETIPSAYNRNVFPSNSSLPQSEMLPILEENYANNTISGKSCELAESIVSAEVVFIQDSKMKNVLSVSNRQNVFNPIIKSGIYRRIIKQNSHQIDNNKPNSINQSMEDKLEFLATDVLQLGSGKYKIYKNRNVLVTKDNEKRRRFIYKIFDPRSLNLHTPSSKVSTNFDKPKRNVGRPRNSSLTKPQPKKQIIPVSITKSGRISKPKLTEDQYDISLKRTNKLGEFDQDISLNEIKDSDFKYYKEIKQSVNSASNTETENGKRQRKLSSDSQCPVCHKILLGKRMKKHFETFPDHNVKNFAKAQSSVYELSLYKFLVNKIKLLSGDDNDQKTDLFLSELSDLIEQIQSRNSKLVQSTSGMHFVSSKLSKILGIPEGQYSINMNAIESVPDPIASIEEVTQLRALAPPQPRLADYNLSISLDDTITAKLNLSDNIVPSEESLLRTVDDLVPQGIKKIGDHDDISLNSDILQLSVNNSKSSVIHYDHASDNAVEALNIKGTTIQPPILDLSLDLFQFSST